MKVSQILHLWQVNQIFVLPKLQLESLISCKERFLATQIHALKHTLQDSVFPGYRGKLGSSASQGTFHFSTVHFEKDFHLSLTSSAAEHIFVIRFCRHFWYYIFPKSFLLRTQSRTTEKKPSLWAS